MFQRPGREFHPPFPSGLDPRKRPSHVAQKSSRVDDEARALQIGKFFQVIGSGTRSGVQYFFLRTGGLRCAATTG